MVQFAVPARVEPVPFAGSAGRLDRCGAVVGREPFRGREPGGVADVSEDQRGDDRSDPVAARAGWSRDASTASRMRILIAARSRSRRRTSASSSHGEAFAFTVDQTVGVARRGAVSPPDQR